MSAVINQMIYSDSEGEWQEMKSKKEISEWSENLVLDRWIKVLLKGCLSLSKKSIFVQVLNFA